MNLRDDFLEVGSIEELQKSSSLPAAIISDKLPNLVLLELCGQKGVRHVIQKSNLAPESEASLAKFMLEKPRDFIREPILSILGLPHMNTDQESELNTLYQVIQSPFDKFDVIEKLQDFSKKYKNPSSVIYDIALVADELITNALYNAPYVDAENSSSGPDRNPQSIMVDPLKRPEFVAGSDGMRIVIGVRDHYGMLNTNQLLERIRSCYEQNIKDLISYKEGGAGIGSFMIFDSCSTMYVAVQKAVATVVCCSFPVGMGASKRRSLPKNVHLLSF
jgi:hypothetical protein